MMKLLCWTVAVLAVAFVGLRFFGVIDWSWWWVLSPLWIMGGAWVIAVLWSGVLKGPRH